MLSRDRHVHTLHVQEQSSGTKTKQNLTTEQQTGNQDFAQ